MPVPSELEIATDALRGELLDLRARAMDEDDLDGKRAQDRDIQQDVGEIVRGDDIAVDRDHENLLPKPWDVLEDAAEIGDFHRGSGGLKHRKSENRNSKVSRGISGANGGMHCGSVE